MAGDVNKSSDSPSQEDEQNREQSNSQLDTDDLHNDPAVLKLVDSFTSGTDDPDQIEVVIGKDEVPPRKEDVSDEGDPKPKDDTKEKKPDEKPAEEEKPADPPKETPSEEAPKAPDTDLVEDDDSYPTEDEVEGHTPNSQKRIRQLVSARKRTEERLTEAEADAIYKRELDEALDKTGTSQESWDHWTDLGFLVQQGEPSVPGLLRKMADNLDGAAGRPLPKQDPPDPATAGKLDEDLQAYVDALNMSPEAAEKMQAERHKAAPAPTPAAAPAAAPQQPDQPQHFGPRLSQNNNDEAAKKAGDAAIAKVNDEMAKKYPSEWEKMVPEVTTEMAKYAGTAPAQWGSIARDAAEKVIARHKGKVTPEPDPTLRSNGGGPKKEAVIETREDFVDAMLSGRMFSNT